MPVKRKRAASKSIKIYVGTTINAIKNKSIKNNKKRVSKAKTKEVKEEKENNNDEPDYPVDEVKKEVKSKGLGIKNDCGFKTLIRAGRSAL